ncbi:MAG: type II toxin-antitoxin system prevent-host-death family antitoxin [Planctomycetota bacterium]
MPRRVSIADTRNHLTRILREVERGEVVEVTRRGQSVAALIPMSEYARLRGERPTLLQASAAFRERASSEDLRLLEGAFDDLRDREEGREVDL